MRVTNVSWKPARGRGVPAVCRGLPQFPHLLRGAVGHLSGPSTQSQDSQGPAAAFSSKSKIPFPRERKPQHFQPNLYSLISLLSFTGSLPESPESSIVLPVLGGTRGRAVHEPASHLTEPLPPLGGQRSPCESPPRGGDTPPRGQGGPRDLDSRGQPTSGPTAHPSPAPRFGGHRVWTNGAWLRNGAGRAPLRARQPDAGDRPSLPAGQARGRALSEHWAFTGPEWTQSLGR